MISPTLPPDLKKPYIRYLNIYGVQLYYDYETPVYLNIDYFTGDNDMVLLWRDFNIWFNDYYMFLTKGDG